MKEITDLEFVSFIMEQPDARRVNMMDSRSHDPCGCVMVHYAKEVLGLQDFGCSIHSILSEDEILARLNFSIRIYFSENIQILFFYGTYFELKRMLHPKFVERYEKNKLDKAD